MNKTTGTGTICYISCLIFYGCLGAVLESDRECFIPGGGIKLRVQEYLPEYIKCRENISVLGKNVSVITDAFSELKAHVLSLKRNNIEAIQDGAFRGSSITVLDLSKNLLKCIFKNQLDINDLKNLNLAENRISYIESGAFIDTLTILNLEKNHLTEFDMYEFPRMKNIRQLNIAQNGLISLNLKKDILTKLERLDLGYNDLHQFDFSDLLSLSYLDLGNNNLRNLQSNSFLDLNNLLDLDFSNNKIEDLGFMVNNFPRLNSLKLQNNNIEKIQGDIFVRSLGELDVSGNKLQNFNFTNNELRNVWRLKMNNMKLENILPSQFMNFDTLYEIELSNNFLSDIDENFNMSTLWRLDLSFNRLSRISNNFINFKALGSLDLSYNNIHFLDVANCNLNKIWKIKLNNNDLVEIRDRNLPNLNSLLLLDLSNNRLKTFDITDDKLGRLRVLDLSFNNISFYDGNIFSSLSALRFLSLRNNFISQVPPTVFFKNSMLFYLDISYNLITAFKYTQQLSKTTLRTFNIFGNPINCLHLRRMEDYCYQNQILMDSCDSKNIGDGRTPICVDYDCDCEKNYNQFTEIYQQKLPKNEAHSCSFEVVAHSGA